MSVLRRRNVHVAENHRRDFPEPIVAAGAAELDPDHRILKMLAARGSQVAAEKVAETGSREITAA